MGNHVLPSNREEDRQTQPLLWGNYRHIFNFMQPLLQQLLICQDSRPPFSLHHGILKRHQQICIGSTGPLRRQLLNELHTSALGGRSPRHQHNLQTASSPPSKHKTVILVVVDRLTKFSHFIALSHPFTSAMIADLFLRHIYRLHGLPTSIVSDRDKVFLSAFWQDLFSALGTSLNLSSSYHPQTDGQTERVNACLENYLRCMSSDAPRQWSNWLYLAEFWYNTSFHTSLQTTPFEALYGYKAPLLALPPLPTNAITDVQQFLSDREHMLSLIKEKLRHAQERMKLYADRHRSEREFNVGDWVYLRLQPYRQFLVQFHHNLKLSAWFYGPYQIVERVGTVAYKLSLPAQSKIHPVFHVSQLKRKLGAHSIATQLLAGVDHLGSLRPEPVAILARRLIPRHNRVVMQVLIQWSNSTPSDATWEDWSHIHAAFPHFNP